jgi:hypothetical protein
MTVPADVVQYPLPTEQVDKVSYALLMSFAGLEDRPTSLYYGFLEDAR